MYDKYLYIYSAAAHCAYYTILSCPGNRGRRLLHARKELKVVYYFNEKEYLHKVC